MIRAKEYLLKCSINLFNLAKTVGYGKQMKSIGCTSIESDVMIKNEGKKAFGNLWNFLRIRQFDERMCQNYSLRLFLTQHKIETSPHYEGIV